MKARRQFNGLIFDLGSTLLYFDADWDELVPQINAALARGLREAGFDLDGEQFASQFRARLQIYYDERENEYVERTTAHLMSALLAEWGYPEAPPTSIRQVLAAMYAVTQAHWQPEADALPTLEVLRQRGYRLGIISNAGDDADVQFLVDKARLRPYFDFILTSAAEGVRKPCPDIFETALKHWGFPPSQVAMIGDTLNADILGAHKSGIYSIWVTRRAGRPQNQADRARIQPDATVETLGELPALLDQLNRTAHR